MRLTLKDVYKRLGATKRGDGLAPLEDVQVYGVSIDSRTVNPGEIFIALKGENFDGHDYIPQALKKGAIGVVSSKGLKGEEALKGITVSDTLKALGDLALGLRRLGPLKVLALTGSNGKTTTKELLASIASLEAPTLSTKGNFNNLVGLPLTLLNLEPQTRLAILEMGMNQPGEITRLTEIAAPNVGLVNSLGAAHLEFFGTLKKVAAAKGELYRNLSPSAIAVVNSDEPLLLAQSRNFKGLKLTFGLNSKAHVRLKNWRSLGPNGQSFSLFGPGAEAGRKIKLNLLGRHNALNALAAAAASLALGLSWDLIEEGLQKAKSPKGRLSPIKGRNGFTVIDDSYNANPTSMAAGLNFLGELKNRGPIGAILGDMQELGPAAPKYHRQLGRLAGLNHLDFLATVGPLSALTHKSAKPFIGPKAFHFESAGAAAEWVLNLGCRKAFVLVKGSRTMAMEKAVEKLTKK
ncbi:MAG: UDP-N-acetylmuramoyl-tripeptide--D-alanyl-D-alanine ligase [Candidatus Adiutrix sp.]